MSIFVRFIKYFSLLLIVIAVFATAYKTFYLDNFTAEYYEEEEESEEVGE